jgi:hypothetical protein
VAQWDVLHERVRDARRDLARDRKPVPDAVDEEADALTLDHANAVDPAHARSCPQRGFEVLHVPAPPWCT